MTAALTSEASTWAMRILGFVGLGLAMFSIAERAGQRAAAEWWKGKLQEKLNPMPRSCKSAEWFPPSLQ